MELRIYWTDFAKVELQKNFKYLAENVSIRVAKNEISKIVQETLRLEKQSEIGQVEPFLADDKREIRYLVHQTYKIIYSVNTAQKQIEAIDIFDTRQYPEKIKRTI